jgi:RNA polymerase sigma factor (sigma-70 family)
MASPNAGSVLGTIGHLFERGSAIGESDARLLERFVAGADEAAFEALVVRHARSVLRVCNHVLHDPHDAEDAFQATFLILARKAGSLWVGDSLAAWLHRVARRVAVEANRRKARRRAVEPTGLDVAAVPAASGEPREALWPLLHEEIDRLPEKYRAPIVLCDLEGLTRDEAAGRLGWRPGTVAGRLARARALLRDRLARRGEFDLIGMMFGVGSGRLATASVPPSWIGKTVRLVILTRADLKGTTDLATIGGAHLAGGVLRSMTVTGLTKMAVLSVVAALAMAAGALALGTTPPETPPVRQPAAASKSRTEKGRGVLPVSGTIALPDGKPAAGVRVFYATRDHPADHGNIRTEVVADEDGRFSLDLPPVDGAWPGTVGTGVLWAYRPRSRVGTIPIHWGSSPRGLPQRLAIGPSCGALFEIHTPDGKPVAGARIEPQRVDRHNAHVPDRLAELIGAETITDARGRAAMAAFSQEEVQSIVVAAEGYGRQGFWFGHGRISTDPKIIRLRPVGRLKGRLLGDPQAIRRHRLRVLGFSAPDDPVQFSYAQEITTDDEGRFDFPMIAAGQHSVRTVDRCDSPWIIGRTKGLVDIPPGQTTEVVLTMKRAVRVRGLVRERGTQKPIAGVRMAVAIYETGAMTTGADGTFQGFMEPNPTMIWPRSVPPGYAFPWYASGSQQMVPEDTVEFDLPPLELTRAGEVRGKVVGEHAQPAIGAEVEATWEHDDTGRGPASYRLKVRSGAEGRFIIPGVPEGTTVILSARHRALRSLGPRATTTGEAVILHLTERIGVSLKGRILDPAGRPIAGASVHLRRRSRPQAGDLWDDEPVTFDGGDILMSDTDGRFRTPPELDRDAEYSGFASAPGYLTSQTPWTIGEADGFEVIRLRPVP